MLSGNAVTNAVVSTLHTNAALVAAMQWEPARISGHGFLYGVDVPIAERILKMTPPFVLVAYEAELGGNYDGATLFKHRLALYMRSGNMATVANPIGIWDVWALICNGPVNGGSHNIRNVEIIDRQLYMVEVPSAKLLQDADGIDYLCGYFVLNEEGDN